jgi:hypothetical protein
MRVVTLNEADTIVLVVYVDEAIGVSFINKCVVRVCKLLFDSLLGFSDLGKLAAGDNDAVFVDDTNGAAYNVLHLMKHCLIQAV